MLGVFPKLGVAISRSMHKLSTLLFEIRHILLGFNELNAEYVHCIKLVLRFFILFRKLQIKISTNSILADSEPCQQV